MGTARKAPLISLLPEDLSGIRIGRFAIRSRLGAGGMGEVYYADDTALQRPVALKRVARRLGNDPKAKERILREAQRASALSSQHIASIHDVVEAHGEVFLVMEYVEGKTLRQSMQRPIDLDAFFRIAMECTEALAAAHDRGIVHCDIKPENIMLTSEGQVKILDFGLAKHLPSSSESSTIGTSAMLAGTPAYMAPEVLLENLPDARSDIFSLAIVFYELLTRKHPFYSGPFVATSERILHQTPTSIRVFNPSVPEALERVIMKAMAKSPAERYPSARGLHDELVRAQHQPAPTDAAATASDKTRFKFGRVAWIAVVAVALIAAAFVSRAWLHSEPLLKERGWVLISDFETSGDERIPDHGVREGLTIALQQSRYLNVFPRNRAYDVLRRMKREDASRIDESLGREICQRENLPILLVGRVEKMGRIFQITVSAQDAKAGTLLFAERERFEEEDQFFEKTDVLAKRIREKLGESLERIESASRPLARVTTTSLEALQFYSRARDARDQGKDEQVEDLLKSALRLDPDFGMAHLRLGQTYLEVVGKNKKAVSELERAYKLRELVTERERLRIEAGYYSLQEQYEDAVQSLATLVSLYPDDEEAHEVLASAYYDLDQLDKATAELREVIRINPSSASGYRMLILYLARTGQSEAALAAARDAQQHGADSPQLHWGLGLAHLGLGDVGTARLEFHRIGQATDTDRNLRDVYLAIADLYEGKLEAAKGELSRQIGSRHGTSGVLQPFRRYLLGRIFVSQGDSTKAGQQAGFILSLPADSLQIVDLLNAGVIYARAGMVNDARRVFRRLEERRASIPTGWNQSCLRHLDGEIKLADANPTAAESIFVTAIQEYPQAASHAGLARAYQAQTKWELAAQEWEEVVKRKGEILQADFPLDLTDAHLQLARAYRATNNPGRARFHYETVLKMWRNADSPLLATTTRELQGFTLDLRTHTPGPYIKPK